MQSVQKHSARVISISYYSGWFYWIHNERYNFANTYVWMHTIHLHPLQFTNFMATPISSLNRFIDDSGMYANSLSCVFAPFGKSSFRVIVWIWIWINGKPLLISILSGHLSGPLKHTRTILHVNVGHTDFSWFFSAKLSSKYAPIRADRTRLLLA